MVALFDLMCVEEEVVALLPHHLILKVQATVTLVFLHQEMLQPIVCPFLEAPFFWWHYST